MRNLVKYWDVLPVGKENAIPYKALQYKWGVSKRNVRKILELLSSFDNGDNYILIRNSRGAGFYLTDDPDDIQAYKRECSSRAKKIYAPLKKINRVLKDITPEYINYSFENNLKLMRKERGLMQIEVCEAMRRYEPMFDVSALSRFENGWALPTPTQLRMLAGIYGCEPHELVAMQKDASDLYVS